MMEGGRRKGKSNRLCETRAGLIAMSECKINRRPPLTSTFSASSPPLSATPPSEAACLLLLFSRCRIDLSAVLSRRVGFPLRLAYCTTNDATFACFCFIGSLSARHCSLALCLTLMKLRQTHIFSLSRVCDRSALDPVKKTDSVTPLVSPCPPPHVTKQRDSLPICRLRAVPVPEKDAFAKTVLHHVILRPTVLPHWLKLRGVLSAEPQAKREPSCERISSLVPDRQIVFVFNVCPMITRSIKRQSHPSLAQSPVVSGEFHLNKPIK